MPTSRPVKSRFPLKSIVLATGLLTLLFIAASSRVKGQQGPTGTLVNIGQIQGADNLPSYVEDEFIVVLKKEVRRGFRVTQGPSNRPAVSAVSLQQAIERHSVGHFKRQFPGAKTEPDGSSRPDLSGHYKVRVPRGVDLDVALADFASDSNVERVEKIGIHPVFLTPNDSLFNDQWHHRGPYGLGNESAWNAEAGDPNVVVAVLDTGVRHRHADLRGNIWKNPGEIANNGIDDDGNGFVDDVNGYDFVESASGASLYTCCDSDCASVDSDPDDSNGHGTHLAGIVAATTNNSIGVAGIAGGFSDGSPGSTSNGVGILPLRIGWNGSFLGLACGFGLIRMDYAAQALHYVASLKARGVNIAAVNASWGSSDTGGLGAAVDEVLANDIMIVHAAGNSNVDTADFLGTKPGVMNVAASDQLGRGADFTNYGNWVDLAAPGVDIMSLWVGQDPSTEYYAIGSGTSMATPMAAGVAGLLESRNPNLSGPEKFALMVATAQPYVDDGRNLGAGILNASLALAASGNGSPDFIFSASPASRFVTPDSAVSFSVTVTSLAGFAGGVNFGVTGLPIGTIATFAPSVITGSGTSTMTVTTDTATPTGSYPVTITATSGILTHTTRVTLEVFIPGEAAFIKTDTLAQGTWKGVYGADGFAIANDVTNYPGYAQVTFSGQTPYTWVGSTTDVRALQKGAATDRIASAWFSNTSFNIDINLLDGNWHQVGVYCLDWGGNNVRVQTIEVLDGATGGLLDSRTVSSFSGGKYLIWNLKGHVKIRATKTAGDNAVVSGVFFDLPAPTDFSLTATPSSRAVVVGSSGSYTVNVNPVAGFSGQVNLAVSGLPAQATASFNPSTVTGSGSSTLNVTVGVTTPGGSYPITITGTSGSLSHSVGVTLVVDAAALPIAAFIKTDTLAQGTWKGVYGADGFAIANDVTNYPGYAQVTFSGQTPYTWVGSTTDVRALQKGAATDRIASAWFSNTSFNIDINLLDGNWHQVGVYCLDWGGNNVRVQTIEVLDGATGGLLDSRTVSSFSGGKYLIWNLKGHVKIRATKTAGDNAVVSGVFFDLPAPTDFSLTATPSSRAVVVGSSGSYTVNVNPVAGFSGQVNLAVSGLPAQATASFNPSTVTGSGSSTLNVTVGVTTPGGSYPITITGTSGSLSHSVGVTLVVDAAALPIAAFIKTDTLAQGTWKGVYGADGFAIANDVTNYPGYAQVTFSGQTPYTWVGSTTDVRALQKGAATDRIASAWFSNTSFNIDINLLDGNWHQVGVYCLDWGGNNVRVQTIEVLDGATGGLLDSRTVSSFSGGKYLIWNLKGHVKIRATKTAGDNAVVSGVFFDLPAPTDFSLTATPSSRAVVVGSSGSYTVNVNPVAGFSGQVNFTVSGLPAQATASFNPSTVTGSGSSTLNVTVGVTTPGGSYPITITGTSGSLSHSVGVTLVVDAAALPIAAFIKTDTLAQGTWKGVYGADGFAIANDVTNYPGYAQVTFSGQTPYTWVGSTTDVRALQKGAATDRIASTWFSNTSFNIDINLLDGNWHQVGVYCLDWGGNNVRVQTIEVLDGATGGLLDSRTVSSFSGGKYLIWNLKGHVKIRATKTAGDNAVVSGVFFR